MDVVKDSDYIHIIMEQCRGGDLFDLTVDDKTRLGEGRVRKIMGSLLDAVAYLHERNIVHRDLKVSFRRLRDANGECYESGLTADLYALNYPG